MSEKAPCQRIVTIGPSPTPFPRCGNPEDHPIHDPLGGMAQSHPYDPAPAATYDTAPLRAENGGMA